MDLLIEIKKGLAVFELSALAPRDASVQSSGRVMVDEGGSGQKVSGMPLT